MSKFHNDNEKEPEWRLTHEELRSCKGFEKKDDQMATSIIDDLLVLARTINQIYISSN